MINALLNTFIIHYI